MVKILLVDDDKVLSDELASWLQKQEKHIVDQAFNGADARLYLETYEYALIILDWEMPDRSGIEVLSEYRRKGGTTPVLMLTGRSQTADKLSGLDTGADDYLTKPFEAPELSARVRALLRRSSLKSDESAGHLLRFAAVEMDLRTRQVLVNFQVVKFQPSEFDLLFFLASHPGQVFSLERLIQEAWKGNERASEGSFRVCLSRVKKKIQETPEAPYIENIPGQGYRFSLKANQIRTDAHEQSGSS